MTKVITTLLVFVCCHFYAQLPDTDIWMFSIIAEKDGATLTNPVNITNRKGYDNQPYFTPDGKSIYFTSIHEDNQADIYQYDINTQQIIQFTKTPVSEYSPMLTPDGKFISCVRVDLDSAQNIYKYPLANKGNNPVKIPGTYSVGYYEWVNHFTLAMFMLPEPFTLEMLDISNLELKNAASDTTNRKRILVRDSIGRGLKMEKTTGQLTYVFKKNDSATYLYSLNPKTLLSQPYDITMVPSNMMGAEDFSFLNDSPIFARGTTLYHIYIGGLNRWVPWIDLAQFGLKKITRLVVSPDGTKLAVVNTN